MKRVNYVWIFTCCSTWALFIVNAFRVTSSRWKLYVGDRVHANARFIHTLPDADAGIARFTTQAGQVAARPSYRMSGACYRRTDVVSWPSVFPEANSAQMLIHKPPGCPRSFFSGNCGRVSTVARVISLFRLRFVVQERPPRSASTKWSVAPPSSWYSSAVLSSALVGEKALVCVSCRKASS
jgi:hypothetical protein